MNSGLKQAIRKTGILSQSRNHPPSTVPEARILHSLCPRRPTHDYLAYGEELTDPEFTTNNMKFTGHERDPETGLDYMLARYYTSGSGRFLQVDPGYDYEQTDPMSYNLYNYTRGNPLLYVDPSGQQITVIKRGDHYTINITATLVVDNKKVHLSKEQIEALRKSITAQLKATYTGSGEGISWSCNIKWAPTVSNGYRVSNPDDNILFVTDNLYKDGGSTIIEGVAGKMIGPEDDDDEGYNTDLLVLAYPHISDMIGHASRVAPHEFGHSVGIGNMGGGEHTGPNGKHWPINNIMYDTYTNRENRGIVAAQVKRMYENFNPKNGKMRGRPSSYLSLLRRMGYAK